MNLLAPEGIAHAHGAPYNGAAYLLVVTDANSKPRLQVFTDQTAYEPEAEAWRTLAQAAQPLTLSITSAVFEEGAIPADGGPFVGGKLQFRIQ